MATISVEPVFQYKDCDGLGARLFDRPCNIPGFQITQLQITLYNKGYLREAADVNGIYDRNTESAHRAYSRDSIDAGGKELPLPHLSQEHKEVFHAV